MNQKIIVYNGIRMSDVEYKKVVKSEKVELASLSASSLVRNIKRRKEEKRLRKIEEQKRYDSCKPKIIS